jgi:hypothetical protein
VAIVNDVVDVDGGCAYVVSNDMAALTDAVSAEVNTGCCLHIFQ